MRETLHQLNRLRLLFSRKDKLQYIGLLGLMIVGAILDLLGIGVIPAFVAVLTVPEKVTQYPPAAKLLDWIGITLGPQLLLLGAIVLLFVFILKNTYMVLMYHLQFKAVEYHRTRLANNLFGAYIHAPYLFHLKKNSAELLRNVNVETLEIVNGIVNPFLGMVMGCLFTLMTVALLLTVTPWSAVVALFFFGIGSAVFFSLVKKRLTEYGQKAKRERKESIKAINQGLGALVDARILGREGALLKVFDISISNLAHVVRLQQVIQKSVNHVMEIIAVTGMVGILAVLLFSGMEFSTLIPLLALYAAATMRLRQSIGSIIVGMSSIQYSLPSIGNVADDLEHLKCVYSSNGKKKIKVELSFSDSIEVSNVSFAYPDKQETVLKNINLSIRPGESIAFVGSTGSGKSTLVNLILGLIPPQNGQILVDGKDIQQNLPEWHSMIGYVSQSIFLLDETIRKNVAFGMQRDEIDDEKLWKTIRVAQLENFVRESPQGLDTRVGERGVRISGGQRQRIGLARALYRDPEIIILDEATAALDNQTEDLLMQELRTMAKDRTFIIVAHRLTTVENCDRIYHLEEGLIQTAGTFEELSNLNEAFRKMAGLN